MQVNRSQVSSRQPGLTSYSHRALSSCYHNNSSSQYRVRIPGETDGRPFRWAVSYPYRSRHRQARLLMESRLLRKENPSWREQAVRRRRQCTVRQTPAWGGLALLACPGLHRPPLLARLGVPAGAPGPRRAAPGLTAPDAVQRQCTSHVPHGVPGPPEVTATLRARGLYESHKNGVTAAGPLDCSSVRQGSGGFPSVQGNVQNDNWPLSY